MAQLGPLAGRHTRRWFLKRLAAGAAAVSLPIAGRAEGEGAAAAADTGGVLVDLTRCVGCRSCENACRVKQGFEPLKPALRGYEPGEGRLSWTNWTFVDFPANRPAAGGDARPVPVKRQCMHCLDPACVSACPVAALHRTPRGSVAYRVERCIGCRYCMLACPFNVPRYEWRSGLTPKVGKCNFCDDRTAAGLSPACVSACPTGALKFGTREQILWEAKARQAAQPKRYPFLLGDRVVGGTAWIYLSDVAPESLGFPSGLPDEALPTLTWHALIKVPFVIVGVGTVLGAIARWRGGGHA